MRKGANFYDEVYAVVCRIPAGKVTNYGRIARMLGRPRAARAVGYALNALKDKPTGLHAEVPWQRVVNSQGRISIRNREVSAELQVQLLRDEGVTVSDTFIITPFAQFLWSGLSIAELDQIINHK